MWLFYTDETNVDPKACEFFLYGGLAFPGDAVGALDDAVSQLRTRLKVPRDYVLKFNPGPKDMGHGDFIELKSEAMKLCATYGAKLLVTLVHHGVIKDGDVDAARRLAMRTVTYHFDCLMHREKSHGLMLFDRFSDNSIDQQIREMLLKGIHLPYTAEYELKKIVGIHTSAIGQSHFPSLVDVVLGSLRFVVNALTTKDDSKMATSAAMAALLSPLFVREWTEKVSEISLRFSPRELKMHSYKEKYQSLIDQLAALGIVPSQSYPL